MTCFPSRDLGMLLFCMTRLRVVVVIVCFYMMYIVPCCVFLASYVSIDCDPHCSIAGFTEMSVCLSVNAPVPPTSNVLCHCILHLNWYSVTNWLTLDNCQHFVNCENCIRSNMPLCCSKLCCRHYIELSSSNSAIHLQQWVKSTMYTLHCGECWHINACRCASWVM